MPCVKPDGPREKRDLRLMREMFGTIAPRYDFITRVISYGMDRRWKRQSVRDTPLPEGAVVLDLACGTGDISQMVLQRLPRARAISVDLTEEMLQLARRRGLNEAVCSDATALPFADGSFDCVFIGYGLRNFPNLSAAVREIERVLRPGGTMVSLEFFLPAHRVLRRIYLAYLYAWGTFWGLLLHGRPRIYTYIPDSLQNFVSIEDFSSLLERMGYAEVSAQRRIFGGIGFHRAVKR